MSTSNADKPKEIKKPVTITPNELKELKRVFHQLCYFAEKSPKLERLKFIQRKLGVKKKKSLDGFMVFTSSPSQHETRNDQTTQNDVSHPIQKEKQDFQSPSNVVHDMDSMFTKLEEEKLQLQDQIKEIESRPDQHIRPQDTGIAMKTLGKRLSKREIQDIMWEVDEKVDGVIDWEEFNLMFERNVRDTSGLEPSSFYYMVQFMIYDSDNNGKVSIDETMNMLYGRVGRAKMEEAISKLFGGENGSPIIEVGNQGGEIDFERFWSVSEVEQRKLFDASEFGRNLSEKRNKSGFR